MGLSEKKSDIKDATRLSTVVHGSYYSSWPSIQRSGLSRMSRQHVHFALGELSSEITSGMRGDCDLLVFLDLPKALKAGLKFFRSANGVILTPGDERGYVSTDLFSRVVYKPALGVRQELPIKNL